MLRTFRLAAVQLALAAMMLRALLPMGWMPNPDGFAQSPLVICLMDMPSGMPQAMDMSHDMDMSKPMGMDMHGHDHGQQQSNEQCPFAAAPHVAAPFTIAEIAPPSELAHFAETPVSRTQFAFALDYHPQSPRAPPTIA
jgi:hypothetical protein